MTIGLNPVKMNKGSFDKEFKKLRKIFIGFFSLLIPMLLFLILFKFGFFEMRMGYVDIAKSPTDIYYENYDVSTLNNSKKNLEIKYGYEIFIKTPNHIGPNSENIDKVYSGNRLSCNNCHLSWMRGSLIMNMECNNDETYQNYFSITGFIFPS